MNMFFEDVRLVEAVALLRSHGLRAIRFEQGFPEWMAGGLPVERMEVRG
jgi:rhodanese-related sulfurtransferase